MFKDAYKILLIILIMYILLKESNNSIKYIIDGYINNVYSLDVEDLGIRVKDSTSDDIFKLLIDNIKSIILSKPAKFLGKQSIKLPIDVIKFGFAPDSNSNLNSGILFVVHAYCNNE